jgi:hypothetical protein
MAEGEEQMTIPVGWLQRLNKREFVSFIILCVGLGSWGYALNGDVASLKDRLARTEAKLEVMEKESAQRDKATSITMAELGVSLGSINERLKAIEQGVRRMAQ